MTRPPVTPSGNWRAYPPLIRTAIRLHRHQRNVTGQAERNRRVFHDPITNDELTLAEEFSWRMQGIIRRWAFLGVITVITAGTWVYVVTRIGGSLGAGPVAMLTWWNLAASYLAILIEGTVGIAMFSATRRDAQFLRRVARLEERADLHWAALERQLGFPCPGPHDGGH